MRYTKVHSAPYNSQVAVIVQEILIKLPIALLLYAVECGGIFTMMRAIVADAKAKPVEWLQLGVPAALYTIQNNMLYVGFANLESAVGLITYQIKIPLTALFSVMLLGKKLNMNQWLSLLVLTAGVILVQVCQRWECGSAVRI